MHPRFFLFSLRPSLGLRQRELAAAFSLTAPFTFTSTFTIPTLTDTSNTQTTTTSSSILTTALSTATTTTTTTTTTSTSDTLSDQTTDTQATSSSSSPSDQASSTLPSSQTSADVPVVSPVTSPTESADTSASGTLKIPAGAIVGIVIGGLIVVLALVILLLRSRFRANRQQRRATWVYQPTVPGLASYPDKLEPVSSAPARMIPVGRNNTAVVKFTFKPDLSDELVIVNGEVLTILQEFDDGWALCRNAEGRQGMVPLECLDRTGGGRGGGGQIDVAESKRVSSLLAGLGYLGRR